MFRKGSAESSKAVPQQNPRRCYSFAVNSETSHIITSGWRKYFDDWQERLFCWQGYEWEFPNAQEICDMTGMRHACVHSPVIKKLNLCLHLFPFSAKETSYGSQKSVEQLQSCAVLCGRFKNYI